MWPLSLAFIATMLTVAEALPCQVSRTRCAFRTGCGAALSNYMVLCNEVLSGPVTNCPERCQHALIALTSTVEGKELMSCQCEDEYCLEAKERMEVCRPSVITGAANATLSCRLSQMICEADAQCAMALDYYDRLCRSMYRGRKCSSKCRNSIEILRKQEKAAPLTECRCDGHEDFDCPKMQNNLARLCFHKRKNHTRLHEKGDKHHKKEQDVKVTSDSDVHKYSVLLTIMAFGAKYCVS